MRNPFIKEVAPTVTPLPKAPEINRIDHQHYFPERLLRSMAEMPAPKRQDIWQTTAGDHLRVEPKINDSGNLEVRVSDAEVAVQPRTPKPREYVITAERWQSSLRAQYLENGKTRYSMRGTRAEDGTIRWDGAVMEWRTMRDRQSGREENYCVSKFPGRDSGALETFERIRGAVNEVADHYTTQMVTDLRHGIMGQIVEIDLVPEEVVGAGFICEDVVTLDRAEATEDAHLLPLTEV